MFLDRVTCSKGRHITTQRACVPAPQQSAQGTGQIHSPSGPLAGQHAPPPQQQQETINSLSLAPTARQAHNAVDMSGGESSTPLHSRRPQPPARPYRPSMHNSPINTPPRQTLATPPPTAPSRLNHPALPRAAPVQPRQTYSTPPSPPASTPLSHPALPRTAPVQPSRLQSGSQRRATPPSDPVAFSTGMPNPAPQAMIYRGALLVDTAGASGALGLPLTLRSWVPQMRAFLQGVAYFPTRKCVLQQSKGVFFFVAWKRLAIVT